MSTKPSPTPFQDVYNCIAMFASYIRSGDQFDVIAEKAKLDAYAELKKAESAMRNHERLVKALSEMVVCYGNSGGCKRNEEGYCTEHASLCPINRSLALLSELEQEEKK